MDMTKITIFEKNINNNFWPKLILIMTYIKNRWLTKVL